MKLFICFVVLSLTFISCKKSESPTESTSTGDFVPLPLKAGNVWVYYHTISGQTTYDTCKIINTTTINSQLTYVLNNQWLFDKDGAYYNEGTLYGLRVSGPDLKLEIIYPKNPIIGQLWHVSDVESTFKLEALNESVTVAAGTFSCSRITGTTNDGLLYTIWWSNGKGIIKASYTSPQENYELASYIIS